MTPKDCVFCQIVAGQAPARKVHDDDSVVAFHDIHPIAPTHILIIPKKHIPNLVHAQKSDQNLLGQIQLAAAKISKELKIDTAFRLLMANGEKAGQSVFHLHYHLIGGWKDHPPIMETR